MTDRSSGIKTGEIMERLGRRSDSHNGENGKVGVIAGSVDYTGAPALAAQAALRSGCDLTEILTSGSVRDVVAGFSENLIVEGYDGDYLQSSSFGRSYDLVEWSDATVIGPGLGDPDPEVLSELAEEVAMSMVIDADAIPHMLNAENSVFTPHRGEVEAINERFGSPEDFVEETGNVVLLKGDTDTIYSRKGRFDNGTGTPAMTVGGTGDVLAGVVASLVSQGLEPLEAARMGAQINGKAGERAAEEYGNGMVATDLPSKIAEVMHCL